MLDTSLRQRTYRIAILGVMATGIAMSTSVAASEIEFDTFRGHAVTLVKNDGSQVKGILVRRFHHGPPAIDCKGETVYVHPHHLTSMTVGEDTFIWDNVGKRLEEQKVEKGPLDWLVIGLYLLLAPFLIPAPLIIAAASKNRIVSVFFGLVGAAILLAVVAAVPCSLYRLHSNDCMNIARNLLIAGVVLGFIIGGASMTVKIEGNALNTYTTYDVSNKATIAAILFVIIVPIAFMLWTLPVANYVIWRGF